MVKENAAYDVAIIGAGCAGLSAAIYAACFGLKAAVISKDKGGLITNAHLVENWPGEKSLSGMELAKKLSQHAESYGIPLILDEISEARRDGNIFVLTGLEGKYRAKSVILATGTTHRKLDVKGEKEFANKGVSYCAVCDAAFFKNKTVAVVGGSDSSAKEALLMAEHASKVFIIYRGDKIRAEPVNFARVDGNKKIEIITKTNIVEIKGDKVVQSVILDNSYKGSKELSLSGIFVAIGHLPQSKLAASLGVRLTDKGEIAVDDHMRTSVPGVFAAGDVVDFDFKQAIVSSAQGTIAAFAAFEYVGKKK